MLRFQEVCIYRLQKKCFCFQMQSVGVGDGVEGHGDSEWCTSTTECPRLDDSDAASSANGNLSDGCTADDYEDEICSARTKKARVC